MQAIQIQTDETLRELKAHGTVSYPFEYYCDEMCVLNNRCIDWHWHDEFEWVFARTGSIVCTAETDSFRLEEGDGAFINSKVLHRFQSEADATMPNILFSPDFIAVRESPVFPAYLEPVIFSDCPYLVFRKDREADTAILTLLNAVFRDAEQEFPDQLNIQIAVLSLWRIFFHRCENAFHSKCPEKKALLASRTRTMLQFIADHYTQAIRLSDIAASAGISKSEALRCFHMTIQATPIDYLIQYRIRQAKHLLRTTDDTVAHIAGQVGMDNINYFNRTFKKQCGMTPRAYRAQWRMQADPSGVGRISEKG